MLPPTTGVHLSAFMHHVYLFLSAHDNNQQESSSTENRYIQLSETSVESLLNSASLTLKELEIPREKLSPGTLQLIKHGRYSSIYRAQLTTGKHGETKTVVLKALKGKARGQNPLCYRSNQILDAEQNFVVITGQEHIVFSIRFSISGVLEGVPWQDERRLPFMLIVKATRPVLCCLHLFVLFFSYRTG